MNTIESFFKPPTKVEPKRGKDLFGYFTKTPKSAPCEETDEGPVSNGNTDHGGSSLDDSIVLFEDPKPVVSKKDHKLPKGETSKISKTKKDKKPEKDINKQKKGKVSKGKSCEASNGINCEDSNEKELPTYQELDNAKQKASVIVVSYEDFLKGSSCNDEKSNQESDIRCPSKSIREAMSSMEIEDVKAYNQVQKNAEKTGEKVCDKMKEILKKVEQETPKKHISQNNAELGDNVDLDKDKFENKKCEADKPEGDHRKRIKTVMLKAFDDTKAGPLPVEEIEGDVPLADTLPKQSNSLFNYFSKGKGKPGEQSGKKQMTVKAEIHFEPSPPKEECEQSSKMFDIFRKKNADQTSLHEEFLKKTPTSNVVVDSKDVEVIVLEGTMAISPKKSPKKNVKRKILNESIKLDVKNSVDKAHDNNSQTDAEEIQVKPLPEDDEEHVKDVETLMNTTLSPIKAPQDIVETSSKVLDAEIALLEKKREIAAQMACLDKVKVLTGKSTQATLCFGKAGFTVLKPSKDSCKPDKIPTQIEEKCLESEVTSSNKKKKSANAKKEKGKRSLTETEMEGVEKTSPDSLNRSLRRARALTSIYRSSIAKSKKGGNAALKMKISRIGDLADQELFTPKSKKSRKQAKLNKAQELLIKAKISKVKKQSPKTTKGRKKIFKEDLPKDSSESEDSGLRRSSRRCALVAKESISLQSELSLSQRTPKVDSNTNDMPKKTPVKGKELSGKPKKTPSKGKKTEVTPSSAKKSPKKTFKKAPVKMAPIFQKGRQASCDSVLTISSGGEDVEITAVEIDPIVLEHQRIRKEFLFSGVPEKLRKQQEESLAVKLSDYTPIPLCNHVQQTSEYNTPDAEISMETREGQNNSYCKSKSQPKTANPWTLSNVCLPIKPSQVECEEIYEQVCAGPVASVNHSRLKSSEPRPQFNAAVQGEIADGLIKHLLAEMTSCNPGFPVRRTYRQLMYRRQENYKQFSLDISENNTKQNQEPKKTALVDEKDHSAGKKRKLDDWTLSNDESHAPQKGRKRRKASTDSDIEIVSVEEGVISKRTRSSRLSRSKPRQSEGDGCFIEDVEVVDDKTQNVKTGQDGSDRTKPGNVSVVPSMLWSDKYSPGHSSEFIGNSKVVKKLKSWLMEWKQRTDLEARKLRKEQVRQAKKAGKSVEEIRRSFGDEWWTDDESDFDLSDRSDESECEEDESLCNTALLTGPCGIGKTCLVYALAQELGYKVFEVNASCRRNGKQILSQLQEATQSHQVSRKNLEAVFTDYMAAEQAKNTPARAKPAKPEKKLPTAFANLFGKGEKKNEKSSERNKAAEKVTQNVKNGKKCKNENAAKENSKTPKKRKNKKSLSPENVKSTSATETVKKKGLDLASISLILFEEADIVFEDDKGFWPAVQTFMSTTKRPILLTANDPNFAEKFKSRLEHHKLRTPSLSTIASYIQSVALVENLRTSYSDLLSLTEYYKGDIRACITQLQCWSLSGGSVCPERLAIKYRAKCLKDKPLIIGPSTPVSKPSSSQTLPGNNAHNRDSADEFEVNGPKRKSRRMILEDDSSCDAQSPMKMVSRSGQNLSVIDEEDSQASQQSQGYGCSGEVAAGQSVDMTSLPVNENTPHVHDMLYESTVCTSQPSQGDKSCVPLAKCLSTLDCENLSAVAFHHKRFGQDILYSNLVHLLPLPKCNFTPLVTNRKTTMKETKITRIINASDLYDSDSEQGFLSFPNKPEEVEPPPASGSTVQSDLSSMCTDRVSHVADHKLCLGALQNMCELYDNLSFCDSFIHSPNWQEGKCCATPHDWDPGMIIPGDSDVAPKQDERTYSYQLNQHDICSQIESRTLLKTKTGLKEVLNQLGSLSEDCRSVTKTQLSLPTDTQEGRLLVSQERPIHKSLLQTNQKSVLAVAKALPCHVYCQRAAVSTDYLPAIRAIFLAEQLRKAGKTKRRFFHYMDDMLAELKDSVVDSLCSNFN